MRRTSYFSFFSPPPCFIGTTIYLKTGLFTVSHFGHKINLHDLSVLRTSSGTVTVTNSKVKQSRYRPGVAQRVPGS